MELPSLCCFRLLFAEIVVTALARATDDTELLFEFGFVTGVCSGGELHHFGFHFGRSFFELCVLRPHRGQRFGVANVVGARNKSFPRHFRERDQIRGAPHRIVFVKRRSPLATAPIGPKYQPINASADWRCFTNCSGLGCASATVATLIAPTAIASLVSDFIHTPLEKN